MAQLSFNFLKNVEKLSADGHNFRAWAIRTQGLIKAKRLKSAFRLRLAPLDSGEGPGEDVNVIDKPSCWSRVKALKPEEAKIAQGPFYQEEKEKQTVDNAWCALSMSVESGLTNMLESSHSVPGVLWAKLMSKWDPRDGISKFDLHNKLQTIDLITFGGDLERFCNEVFRIGTTLRESGDPTSDDYLMTCLLNGLRPKKKWKNVKLNLVAQRESRRSTKW